MNKQQENSKSKKTNDGIWFSKKRPNNTTITKIDADKKLHIKNLFFIIVAHPLILRDILGIRQFFLLRKRNRCHSRQ